MCSLLYRLVGIEDTLAQTACLEEREAKEYGVAHTSPDGVDDIVADSHRLQQYSVDGDAQDDEESLKAQGKKRSEIVLTHLPGFAVHHGRQGDRRNGSDHIDLNHAAIYDHKDTDRQRPADNGDQHGLEPQAEQCADVHFHQAILDIRDDGFKIDSCIGNDDAGCVVHHSLSDLKYAHNDVPGVGDNHDSAESLHDPLEKVEGFELRHIIAFDDHLDQFICHHAGQNQSCNGDDDVFRQAFDHVENAGIPALRCCAYDCSDVRDLVVDGVEHAGEVTDNAADKQVFQPFGDLFPDKVQGASPPLQKPLPLGREGPWLIRAGIIRKAWRAWERG